MPTRRSAARRPAAERLIEEIEAAEWLDRPAYALANAVALPQRLAGDGGRTVRNALHGVGFGHPLHPSLVSVPIGCWTLALALDAAEAAGVAEADGAGKAADLAVGAGAAGAVLAAAAGLVDFQKSHGRTRRVGLAHAAVNTTALGLQLASLRMRRDGRRTAGRIASAAAWSLMFAGGYLGGHMVYRRRQGVDQADRSPVPREFAPVLRLDDLPADRPVRVDIRDPDGLREVPVVLVRQAGRIHAVGARCSHMGGPLDEGWLVGDTLVCPWHGSRYDLSTGVPLDGPSTCPLPRYQVRVRSGVVEIRREQEPGSDAVTAQSVAEARQEVEAGDGPLGRTADEVLFEHHQILRGLFRRIEEMDPADPARRDLMRTLATELDIHEAVEDALFYPAMRDVSEDVAIAHAEHQELADTLAAVLKLPTSSPEFDRGIRILHAAVDHHASSEERSMFLDAHRLGEHRLRRLGHEIEAMLEHERASRLRNAFRDLKHSLLATLGTTGGPPAEASGQDRPAAGGHR